MLNDTDFSQVLHETRCHTGESLAALADKTPVLIVFLRHAGCAFCREALGDLAAARTAIEQNGAAICLVHMGPESHGGPLIGAYGLGDVPRISDPTGRLYRAFGLERGRMRQLFSPVVVRRGMEAVVHGNTIGTAVGDTFQLPGVFLLHEGQILQAYRHETAADRPDYAALANVPLPETAHS